MQSSSSAKPLLILTIGIPGAGKSFFARRFAETFNAPLVSYDEIRYELFNEITYSDDENDIVGRIVDLQLRELIKTNKSIIIDGGHNPKVNRVELGKLARRIKYDILCVWVQTDQRTAKERSLSRSSRRNDDQFNRSLSPEEFERMIRKFTPPSQYERYVVVSGRHTYATQVKTVLKNIVTPQETAIKTGDQTKQTGRDRRTISL